MAELEAGLRRRVARTAALWIAWCACAGVSAQFPSQEFLEFGDSGYSAETMLLLAEDGDARAAYLLGSRFSAGGESERDDKEALRWFRVAANGGLAEAQYQLGTMYAQGRGVDTDLKQAANWLRQASAQGLEAAGKKLHELGLAPQDESVPLATPRVSTSSPRQTTPVAITPRANVSAPAPGSWIAGLSPDAHTIQVSSFINEAGARRFLAQHFSGLEAGIHVSVRDGQRWYAVYFGEFLSRRKALAAVKALPAEVRRQKPWVRSVASVQKLNDTN